MGFSYLLSLICRGSWMILPQNLDFYISIIDKMIDGRGAEYREKLMKKDLADIRAVIATSQGTISAKSSGYTDAPAGSIAVIPVTGTMTKNDTLCEYGVQRSADLIRQAADSNNIDGIVLQIDSPGGAVDAVAPLAQAIQYCQAKKKCVVASCDLCASAAYYVATYCDAIMADNTISAMFGSIGVMMSFKDFTAAEESEGIKTHTIYSNLSTFKNKPYLEALEGKYELVRSELLDPMAEKFRAQVTSARSNIDKKCEGILEGRMFYAEDALRIGLIDGIGDLDAACKKVRTLTTLLNYSN